MFKYSIVIVTYNRLELLKECIECAATQTLKPTDIIIVNNASTDGTKEFLMTVERDDEIKWQILNEEKNLGGAGGFHEGLKYASTLDVDWVLLIDDDAMIDKNFLHNINAFAEKNEAVYAYSGVVVTNGEIVTTHRRRLGKDRVDVPLAEYDADTFGYDSASFCGLLVSNKVVRQIGLPRDDFFIWYDDTEYSLRIREHSKIVNVNNAFLNHKTYVPDLNAPEDMKMNWKSYYGIRNSIYTYRMYGYKHLAFVTMARNIKWSFVGLIKLDRKTAKYNFKLIHSAVHDGIKGRLGKNPKYLP